MNVYPIVTLLALSLATGCGTRALDLDTPVIEASNEPGVLAIVHEKIDRIAVDDQRLYWSGYRLTPDDSENFWLFHSCQKRACAATLVTYDAGGLYRAGGIFSAQGGQVYWYRYNEPELYACPVSGCDGSPRVTASELKLGSAAFAKDRLYFSVPYGPEQGSLNSLSLTQPGPSTQITPPTNIGMAAITTDDAYVYWLEYRYGEGDSKLLRIRQDGALASETVANDVRVSGAHAIGLTTDATAVYWTNNQLAGSIHRCPLAGCDDRSDVVGTPLRAPGGLWIDGSTLYYLSEAKPLQYTLASCTLPACAESLSLLDGLDAASVAIDDQYVYVATTEQDLNPDASYLPTPARIRRLAKTNRELP